MKKYRLPALLLALLLLLPTLALAFEEPDFAAAAVLLVDADSGDVLYAKNPDEHRFPASITKIMTALLTLEAVERGELDLEQPVTASETYRRDLSADGSTQDIKPGETMTLHELLYCTLVASANEACNILAETVSGSISAFVELMNQRAAELGMTNTNFANTHGLHNANHYTSAHDVYLMTAAAMKYPTFQDIVSAVNHTVPATNLSDERLFYTTNALLTNWKYPGYTYSYATGIKTGHTPEAGQCLVSSAVKDGRTLISVVLGADNVKTAEGKTDRQSFSESKRLLEYGFANFSRQTVLSDANPIHEVPVTLSAEVSSVLVRPETPLEVTLRNDIDLSAFQQEVELFYPSVEAPVTTGQVLGRVTVTNGDTTYPPIPLVAVNDVERSELLYRLHQVKLFFSQTWVKILAVVLVVLIILLILRFTVFKSRRRGGGSSGYRGSRRR